MTPDVILPYKWGNSFSTVWSHLIFYRVPVGPNQNHMFSFQSSINTDIKYSDKYKYQVQGEGGVIEWSLLLKRNSVSILKEFKVISCFDQCDLIFISLYLLLKAKILRMLDIRLMITVVLITSRRSKFPSTFVYLSNDILLYYYMRRYERKSIIINIIQSLIIHTSLVNNIVSEWCRISTYCVTAADV